MTIHENKQLPRVLPPAGNHTPLFYFHTSSRHGLAFQQAFQGVKVLKDDMRAYSKGYLAAALAGCAATAFAQESQQRLAVVVPAYVGDLDRAVSSLGRWPSTCSTITQQNVDLVLYYAEGEEDAAAVDAAAATVAATAGRCFSKTLTVYAHLSEEVRGESTFRREEFISKVKRKGSHPPAWYYVLFNPPGFSYVAKATPVERLYTLWVAGLSIAYSSALAVSEARNASIFSRHSGIQVFRSATPYRCFFDGGRPLWWDESQGRLHALSRAHPALWNKGLEREPLERRS